MNSSPPKKDFTSGKKKERKDSLFPSVCLCKWPLFVEEEKSFVSPHRAKAGMSRLSFGLSTESLCSALHPCPVLLCLVLFMSSLSHWHIFHLSSCLVQRWTDRLAVMSFSSLSLSLSLSLSSFAEEFHFSLFNSPGMLVADLCHYIALSLSLFSFFLRFRISALACASASMCNDRPNDATARGGGWKRAFPRS